MSHEFCIDLAKSSIFDILLCSNELNGWENTSLEVQYSITEYLKTPTNWPNGQFDPDSFLTSTTNLKAIYIICNFIDFAKTSIFDTILCQNDVDE